MKKYFWITKNTDYMKDILTYLEIEIKPYWKILKIIL